MIWTIDAWRALLCLWYQLWEGDCSDFENLPADEVADPVMLKYAQLGLPSMTQTEREDAGKYLDMIEAMLGLSTCPLSSGKKAQIAAWIAAVRADLAAMGGA